MDRGYLLSLLFLGMTGILILIEGFSMWAIMGGFLSGMFFGVAITIKPDDVRKHLEERGE